MVIRPPEAVPPLRLWTAPDGTYWLRNAHEQHPPDYAFYGRQLGIMTVGVVQTVPSEDTDLYVRTYCVTQGRDLAARQKVIVTANMGEHHDSPQPVHLGDMVLGMELIDPLLEEYEVVSHSHATNIDYLMGAHQERIRYLDADDLTVGGLTAVYLRLAWVVPNW